MVVWGCGCWLLIARLGVLDTKCLWMDFFALIARATFDTSASLTGHFGIGKYDCETECFWLNLIFEFG
jgi:hypothetical protein